jgi:hypothetical protein
VGYVVVVHGSEARRAPGERARSATR